MSQSIVVCHRVFLKFCIYIYLPVSLFLRWTMTECVCFLTFWGMLSLKLWCWYMYLDKYIFCKSSWPPHSTLSIFRKHICISGGQRANNISNKSGMVWIKFAGSYQEGILFVVFSRWWSVLYLWVLEDGYRKKAFSSEFLCAFLVLCPVCLCPVQPEREKKVSLQALAVLVSSCAFYCL